MEVSKVGTLNTEDIQTKLDKKLGPEYISKRIGFGASRVAYIEGWKAINLANQIFGYNGWSTEVKNITIDFMDESQGKFCVGCTAIIRVTLKDGTFREDIGYGTVENERRKSSAFERAKKSAVTDALKRSLRAFGNALGNCLYDKTFLAKIDKVKFDPPDFDEGNLYRATDELNEPARSHTVENDGAGPPSKRRNMNDTRPNSTNAGNLAPAAPLGENQQRSIHAQQQSRQQPQPLPPQPEHDPDELLDDSFMFSDELQDEDILAAGTVEAAPTTEHVLSVPRATDLASEPFAPVAFVTAKAAPNLQNKAPVPTGGIFDPKFKAQSIRHTVDQTTSSHIKTSMLREKGLPNHRSDIYNRFAPKGKLLDDTNTSADSRTLNREPQPQPQPQSATNTLQNSAVNESRPNANQPARQQPPKSGNSVPAQARLPSMKPVGKGNPTLPNVRN
ncbi:LANO_0H11958g1_1 [Lachancea nothofagi CBS 11611]|uniref:DNA repair and recombination protein RAD52 n=1 Tax=Lachancea nothofagi CBS 11611 TaxID=1266666 RepID=A0A1G4KMB6_9SACH|nr:LANO_0H11958g1_1 [Lachancea nothofagi CBS 11611]